LQDPDQAQSLREAEFYFKETSFHDAETPLCSTADFHDAETPLCRTDDFHDAETPLFNTFPMLKHHCSALFISSHPQNTPVRHFLIIFISETTPSSTCFAFLPSVAETPLSTTFHFLPVAETPLPATLHHFSRC
jgi:hypothetical protein